MTEQIKSEVDFFQEKPLSIEAMEKHFSDQPHMIKIQISNNKIKVFASPEMKNSWVYCRYDMFSRLLKDLAKKYDLPNVTLFLGLRDSYDRDQPFPLFVFARKK